MHSAWQIDYEIAGAVMHSIASVADGTQSVSRYWRGCSSLNWFSKPRILVDPAIGPRGHDPALRSWMCRPLHIMSRAQLWSRAGAGWQRNSLTDVKKQ